MSKRRIIIGDVHGHYETLLNLLEFISLNQEDEVYFLGDLIDRGPESAQVVQFVMDNNYPCLMGNHEQMLIEAVGSGEIIANLLQSWVYTGGYTTLLSYNHNIPHDHIEWMKNLPLYLDLGDLWLVHAGVNPSLPVEKQTSEECCWIRGPFHNMSRPYFPNKLIITGHTITFTFPGAKAGQVVAGPGWLDIDTGAYHPRSGWLTAFDTTNNLVYQANVKTKEKRKKPIEKLLVHLDRVILANNSYSKK